VVIILTVGHRDKHAVYRVADER